MTPPQQQPRGRGGLAVVPTTGVLAGGRATYAFSARCDGTMAPGIGRGDAAGARAALASRVGVDAPDVAWMRQVHGATVVRAGDGTGPRSPDQDPICDGIVSTRPDAGVGVVVADCVPVLLHAPGGVAAAHAGRAGLVAGVVPATVQRLLAVTGARSAEVTAVIGPAIGPCCYELPADLAQQVDRAVPGTAARTSWGTPSVDLVGGVSHQLAACGVPQVSWVQACTRCHVDRWFSHRGAGAGHPPGRQAGVIVRRTAQRRAA